MKFAKTPPINLRKFTKFLLQFRFFLCEISTQTENFLLNLGRKIMANSERFSKLVAMMKYALLEISQTLPSKLKLVKWVAKILAFREV